MSAREWQCICIRPQQVAPVPLLRMHVTLDMKSFLRWQFPPHVYLLCSTIPVPVVPPYCALVLRFPTRYCCNHQQFTRRQAVSLSILSSSPCKSLPTSVSWPHMSLVSGLISYSPFGTQQWFDPLTFNKLSEAIKMLLTALKTQYSYNMYVYPVCCDVVLFTLLEHTTQKKRRRKHRHGADWREVGGVPAAEAVGVGGPPRVGNLRRNDPPVRSRPHAEEGWAVLGRGAQHRGK